jgi:hypothetical protein
VLRLGFTEAPAQPARHGLLHEPLPVPGKEHRTAGGQLAQQPGVPEENDEVGAGGVVCQCLAGADAEPRPAFPGAGLGEDQDNPGLATDQLRPEHPMDVLRRSRWIWPPDIVVDHDEIQGADQRRGSPSNHSLLQQHICQRLG